MTIIDRHIIITMLRHFGIALTVLLVAEEAFGFVFPAALPGPVLSGRKAGAFARLAAVVVALAGDLGCAPDVKMRNEDVRPGQGA
jgi:hypothetical protein